MDSMLTLFESMPLRDFAPSSAGQKHLKAEEMGSRLESTWESRGGARLSAASVDWRGCCN